MTTTDEEIDYTDPDSLLDGLDERVVERLRPDHSVWAELPASWVNKLPKTDEWKESPSSIVSYLGCPLKWFLERYGIEGDDDSISRWALLGTITHRIFEVFYSDPAQNRDEDLLWEVYEEVWKELTEGTNTGIVDSRTISDYRQFMEEQEEAGEDPDEVLDGLMDETEGFVGNLHKIDGDYSEIDVVSVEGWVHHEANGIRINGKIDRVVKDPDSELEIVQDYKTGKDPWGNPTPHVLEEVYVPCGLYALMRSTKRLDGESGTVRYVELLYVKSGNVFDVEIGPDELRMSEDLVEGVTREMRSIRATGQIKMNPVERADQAAPCRFCPVSGFCPAFTEEENPFAEMIEEFPDDLSLLSTDGEISTSDE